MDMATILEGKEGPGDVQVWFLHFTCFCLMPQTSALGRSAHICLQLKIKLIEVEADVYHKITTRSENDGQ